MVSNLLGQPIPTPSWGLDQFIKDQSILANQIGNTSSIDPTFIYGDFIRAAQVVVNVITFQYFLAVLQVLPSELVPKLASLDQGGLKAVAQKWAASMSTPEHTHSVSGQKLNDGWKPSEAIELLQPLVALARQGPAQRMYLLIEA